MYTIYRIEHEDSGIGPFRNSFIPDSTFTNRHDGNSKYPTPKWDFPSPPGNTPGFKAYEWYTACPTYRLLLSWFTPMEMRELKEQGYILRKLIVKDIKMGLSNRQCFFRIEDVIKN